MNFFFFFNYGVGSSHTDYLKNRNMFFHFYILKTDFNTNFKYYALDLTEKFINNMKANEMLSSMQEFEVLPVPSSTKNCLGLGSFGIVKLARHRTSNKKYALKIVFRKDR